MAEREKTAPDTERPPEFNRRRFRLAALVAMAVGAVPYLWILWAGRLDPLRGHPSGFFSNFYDLQARALMDGRWDVPAGTLGIEAFVIDGKEYMYFGPFPAVLRMPVLAVTDAVDGELTTVSMLLAWAVTGLFTSLLIWRVRELIRGQAPLSRLEALSLGALILTVTTGSTIITLAAVPAVYYEAEAWGVAAAIGALWALLGVLQRPSTGRVVGAGALILVAVSSRLTLGWACVIGGLLVALWFAVGQGGAARRTAAVRVLAITVVIPLVVAGAVNWVKFGHPGTQPLETQVFTQENEHRQEMLAANDNRFYGPQFLPTTGLAYLRPDALRVSAVYPFITMPDEASPEVGDAVLDLTYRTTSVPSSMPLLVLLSIGGLIAMIRRRREPWPRVIAIPVAAGAAGCAGVMLWGSTAQRSLGDFLPFLAVAAAIGLTVLWELLVRRSRRARLSAVALVGLLACFGLVANFGIATESSALAGDGEWARDYVETQLAVADVVGRAPEVERRDSLPSVGTPGRVYVIGDCEALYLATGEDHFPRWQLLDHGPGQRHLLDLTYHELDGGPVQLLDFESEATLGVEDRGIAWTRYIRFVLKDDTGTTRRSRWVEMEVETPYRVDIITDL